MQGNSLPSEPPGKPKNTGVGSLSLLQGIFPTQESNRTLLHSRWILYQLSYLNYLSPFFSLNLMPWQQLPLLTLALFMQQPFTASGIFYTNHLTCLLATHSSLSLSQGHTCLGPALPCSPRCSPTVAGWLPVILPGPVVGSLPAPHSTASSRRRWGEGLSHPHRDGRIE